MTPLRLEQYYEAADEIIDSTYSNSALWKNLVPEPYHHSWWSRFTHWLSCLLTGEDKSQEAVLEAEKVIIPFASKAFRRFLSPDEKKDYLTLFRSVYEGSDQKDRYGLALKQVFKAIIVSPKFL